MQELLPEIQNKKILIVDDAASMRGLLSAIIKSFGLSRIYEASDGKEALQILQNSSVDAIFCDWEMPKMDGLQLFEALKNEQTLNDIPFVLVTSMAELDKVKVAVNAGIKEYIVKPFKPDTIQIKLNTLFAGSAK